MPLSTIDWCTAFRAQRAKVHRQQQASSYVDKYVREPPCCFKSSLEEERKSIFEPPCQLIAHGNFRPPHHGGYLPTHGRLFPLRTNFQEEPVRFHCSPSWLVGVRRVQVCSRTADDGSPRRAMRKSYPLIDFHLPYTTRVASLCEVVACCLPVAPFKGTVPSTFSYRFKIAGEKS